MAFNLLDFLQAAAQEAPAFRPAPSSAQVQSQPQPSGGGPADIADILDRISAGGQGGPDQPAPVAAPEAPPEAVAPPEDPQDVAVAGYRGPYDHRGMFGIRGTPRNILGVLGDAFLVQSGNRPSYEPRRQREQEADALRGFADDPVGAINRLSRQNPEAAREMWNQYQTQQRMSRQEARLIRDSDAAYQTNTDNRALQFLAAANERNYPQILNQINRYYAARGVTPSFELPQQYDAEAIRGLRESAVPVDRQVDDEANAAYRAEYLRLRREDLDVRRQELGRRTSEGQQRENRLNEPRPVGRYVGVDGRYRIVWDDGRETISNSEVRPTGRPRRSRPGSTPQQDQYWNWMRGQ